MNLCQMPMYNKLLSWLIFLSRSTAFYQADCEPEKSIYHFQHLEREESWELRDSQVDPCSFGQASLHPPAERWS